LRLGSREPGAALAARAQTKGQEDQVQGIWDPLANFGLRVKDSNLKHWETFSQRLAVAPSLIANAAFSLPFTSSA
jgi:hypothetical protein